MRPCKVQSCSSYDLLNLCSHHTRRDMEQLLCSLTFSPIVKWLKPLSLKNFTLRGSYFKSLFCTKPILLWWLTWLNGFCNANYIGLTTLSIKWKVPFVSRFIARISMLPANMSQNLRPFRIRKVIEPSLWLNPVAFLHCILFSANLSFCW